MDRPCPHCEEKTLAAADEPGVWRCTDCGRSCLASDTGPTSPRDGRLRPRRAPGEGADWLPAVGALVFTLVFYGLLRVVPAGRVGELFLERGFVPVLITGASAWALLLIGARWGRLQAEAKILEVDLFAAESVEGIRAERAGALRRELETRAGEAAEGFLVARLDRALRQFEVRPRISAVLEFLSSESAADEGRVDASYALVRVFVWAVPTLGFIGTVLGLGAAVGGFSESLEAAANLDGLKTSIGSVTGGLGVAFDTTLLALVLSIVIMFPASIVQRMEEALVGAVDDYCAEWLVPRLREAKGGDDEAVAALAAKLVERLRASEAGNGD
ncbi:MAG: MotA/TolQ/ExbB proton channel family protein [Myxococcota bacterium]